MVCRALRILGLLVLVSGTAAAHPRWSTQSRARWSAAARAAGAHQTQSRDATGRVWSNVALGELRGTRAADGRFWTTRHSGGWSYSYSSDGTRCVSQRTAHRVFISCN